VAVLEYEISDIQTAKILSFKSFRSCDESKVLKGLVNEILYWNPYIQAVLYDGTNDMISSETLMSSGFSKEHVWILYTNSNIEVFKININKITPEQLTVDRAKLSKVSSWVEKPEDIIVTCVKIEDKIVTIDGYSRLVAAFNKGFDYVYAHFDPENTSVEFYKTCLKWCEEEGVCTIKDLSKRVVSPDEHQRLWVDRCQAYLRKEEGRG
jgi:hypothetical protein